MKIGIKKDALLNGVTAVIKATGKAMDILKAIKFTTVEGGVMVSATDLEVGIEKTVPAEVEEGGAILLPADGLLELVKKLPTDVTIETNENTVTFRYNLFSEITLVGLNPDEFPVMPVVNGTKVSLQSDLFKAVIKRTIIAVGNDDDRPVFKGALLEYADGTLKVVATDTHRLAYEKLDGLGVAGEWTAIVPGKALSEVVRLIDDGVTLDITVSDNQAMFSFNGVTLVARLIDGKFAPYEQVIPTSYESKVVLKRDDFLNAADRAALIAKKSDDVATIVKMSFQNSKLAITAQSDIGKAHEEVVTEHDGKDIEISFNHKLVTDALKAVSSKEVILKLNGPTAPGVICPNSEDGSYLYLVLPMRTAA